MTPAVRRLLREHGLDAGPDRRAPAAAAGSPARTSLDVVEAHPDRQPSAPGRRGRAAAARAAPAAPPPAPAARRAAPGRPPAAAGAPIAFPDGADEVLVPMTQMRKGIAAQMTRALAVPHAYVQMEVDVTAPRPRSARRAKRDYQAREGISLSYVPFVIKAAVEALKRNPTFNAHWTDAGPARQAPDQHGRRGRRRRRAASCRSSATSTSSRSTASTTRSPTSRRGPAPNKLRLDDFGGGTFTVDNTGWLGSNLTMPIINVPEVAILTMEAITKRAGRRRDARRRRRSRSGRS